MHYFNGLTAVGLGVVLLTLGCSDGEAISSNGAGSEALVPCDPLAAVERPISLEQIIAIGQAQDGTLYVVDDGGDSGRVFVSHGDELVRARVVGSGEGVNGSVRTYQYAFETSEGESWSVAVEIRDGAVRMALMRDDSERDFAAIAAAGEELTLLEESSIEGLELHNLPGEVETEYFARAEDGSHLVVVRPRDDWSYEDFRVFYGDGSILTEEHVSDVLRMKDGGTTYVTFELDGKEALAYFPSPLSSSDEEASLTIDDEGLTLTELDPPNGLGDFSFECFE